MSVATPTLPIPTRPQVSSATPRKVAWTVEMFHRAAGQKVWGEGRRLMLIRGELLDQGMMNPPHATALDLVGHVLRTLFRDGWLVRSQTPLVLGLETDPMPDFSVFLGSPRDFSSTHPTTASLVVEVSDSTLYFDQTTKAELYATANIPEYWALDLENRCLIVHRDPQPIPDGGSAYRTRLALSPTDRVSPLATPDVSVGVAELLP